jgi:cobyrinic acid a,c-diamide synthase
MPVIGAVQRQPALRLAERHLGLIPSSETTDAEARIAAFAAAVSAQVELDRVVEIAARAPAVAPPPEEEDSAADLRIAIARDSAFGFYYADDLEALRAAGARLLPFDTMADARLPAADGLFIGGGFPECHLAALEANAPLRHEIRNAIAGGLPAYAECGGLAYLARSISWRGETAEMVGAVAADAVVHETPQGRGYTRLRETGAGPWATANGEIAAHEFHYTGLKNLTTPSYAYEVLRGTGIDGRHDGIVHKNLLAAFAHRRNVAADPWAARFVDFVRQCRAT